MPAALLSLGRAGPRWQGAAGRSAQPRRGKPAALACRQHLSGAGISLGDERRDNINRGAGWDFLTHFLFCSAVTIRPRQPPRVGCGRVSTDGRRLRNPTRDCAGGSAPTPEGSTGPGGGSITRSRGTTALFLPNPSGRNVVFGFFCWVFFFFNLILIIIFKDVILRSCHRCRATLAPQACRAAAEIPSAAHTTQVSCAGWTLLLMPHPSATGNPGKAIAWCPQPPLASVQRPSAQSPSGTCPFCLKLLFIS